RLGGCLPISVPAAIPGAAASYSPAGAAPTKRARRWLTGPRRSTSALPVVSSSQTAHPLSTTDELGPAVQRRAHLMTPRRVHRRLEPVGLQLAGADPALGATEQAGGHLACPPGGPATGPEPSG